MSYKDSFEPSARTADIKNNAIGHADLDDALIGQALSIFQGLRQNKTADNILPVPSGDQALPPAIRNQRDLLSGLINGACEKAPTIRNSGIGDVVDRNRLAETIINMINGSSDQHPTVRRSDKREPANIPKTGDSIRSVIGPNGEVLPSTGQRLKDLINGTNDRLPNVIRSGISEPANLPKAGDSSRGNIEPNSDAPSSLGRAFKKFLEGLDNAPDKQREFNPREFFLCRAEIPNSDKELLRRFEKGLIGPRHDIACTSDIGPIENDSIKKWLHQNGPSETFLCSARTPITGKPEPGNYYACVHHYPLKIKDGVISIQSD